MIYLSKYVEGMSAFCSDVRSREHVKDLRNDLENKLQSTNQTVTGNRETDQSEKGVINLSIEELEKKTKEFR